MQQEQKRIIFLEGKKIVLRPPRKSTDLEVCLRWLNDPEIRDFIKMFLPVLEQVEEKWFDELPTRKNDVILAIETLEDEKFIGTMGLHRINWKDRTAFTGAIIGEKEYWGNGYGTDAKMSLLNYAFNTLNFRKTCSSVFAFNERSLRFSHRCGSRIEGRRKEQVFKDGEYWDEILLAVFKEEWLPIWEKYQKTGSVK